MAPQLSSSDTRRSAQKYDLLIYALRHATQEIRTIETEGRSVLEDVLVRLLPDITSALNGEQGFIARRLDPDQNGEDRLGVVAVHPSPAQGEPSLACAGILASLLHDGEPKVIDPLDETSHKPILGLELFAATSAILARIQTIHQTFVVGVCNKADPSIGPFLAADGRALDSIAEMLAVGVRAGERRQRELEKIQEMLTAISAELDLKLLLPLVARSAAEVFSAPAASVMLWDKSRQFLVIEEGWGLTPRYIHEQRIAAARVQAAVGDGDPPRTLIIPNLQEMPFGDAGLIREEDLGSALMALLLRGQEFMGVLNVYSKGSSRHFTTDEARLARIFADEVAIALENARRFEEAKEQDQQLARTNTIAIMGAWGAEIVHDVHSEVRSIRWALRTLQRLHGLDAEALAAIRRIQESAEALVLPELPDQVPAPGDTSDLVEPTALDQVLAAEAQRLRDSPLLAGKSLRFVSGCPGIQVLMSQQWIRRMLRHLVKNAAKALSEEHDDPRIVVRTEIDGGLARVWVEDNGRGVRPEIAAVLFHAPVSHTGRRSAERAGRGLLLVRYVMEQHGGAARLGWNRPPEGCGFVLELPVADK